VRPDRVVGCCRSRQSERTGIRGIRSCLYNTKSAEVINSVISVDINKKCRYSLYNSLRKFGRKINDDRQ